MNHSRTVWRRDIILYGAIAFFGAVATRVTFFPTWVTEWSGIVSLTLLAVKAKLSNGKPPDTDRKV